MDEDVDWGEENQALSCQAVYLLRGSGECWACKKQTQMFALMALPPLTCGGYSVEANDEDGTMLSNVVDLPATLVDVIRPSIGTVLRVDYSKTIGESYAQSTDQNDVVRGLGERRLGQLQHQLAVHRRDLEVEACQVPMDRTPILAPRRRRRTGEVPSQST